MLGRFGLWELLILVSVPLVLVGVGMLVAVLVSRTGRHGRRRCPYCAELIRREAILCRYCGRDVDPLDSVSL
jgi:hypothetical protein